MAEAVTSIPPAQPISISSSSSVSRFNKISPVNWPGFKPSAPVIPVSSSMVKSASIAGWAMSLLSKILIMAATPSPLSAPKVVPLAFTQSPSTYISIPCVSKSKSTSLFFWQTMSRWDCKTTVWRFSIPAVAGFLMITFPTSSTEVGKPRFSPKFLIKAITLSSFLEGRGTALSAAKFFQIFWGSKWVIDI